MVHLCFDERSCCNRQSFFVLPLDNELNVVVHKSRNITLLPRQRDCKNVLIFDSLQDHDQHKLRDSLQNIHYFFAELS